MRMTGIDEAIVIAQHADYFRFQTHQYRRQSRSTRQREAAEYYDFNGFSSAHCNVSLACHIKHCTKLVRPCARLRTSVRNAQMPASVWRRQLDASARALSSQALISKILRTGNLARCRKLAGLTSPSHPAPKEQCEMDAQAPANPPASGLICASRHCSQPARKSRAPPSAQQ